VRRPKNAGFHFGSGRRIIHDATRVALSALLLGTKVSHFALESGNNTMTKVFGLGAGGHARVIIDIVRCMGEYEIVGLIDRDATLTGKLVEGVEVIGTEELLPELKRKGIDHFFIGVGGVGDNTVRARLFSRVMEMGFTPIRTLHPRAIVAASAKVGDASVVMAGAIINPGAAIGVDTIINTGAVVDHDCQIGDHVHIAPGVTLSGNVTVGTYSHLGTGASVKQGIRIGSNTVVGAGAVVVHDLPDNVTAVGVPAKVTGQRAKSAPGTK
jgi:sugar O-acyltransferase (sialic acid O-acetyltransferase NeuD family)